jgi:hypothetical protein
LRCTRADARSRTAAHGVVQRARLLFVYDHPMATECEAAEHVGQSVTWVYRAGEQVDRREAERGEGDEGPEKWKPKASSLFRVGSDDVEGG